MLVASLRSGSTRALSQRFSSMEASHGGLCVLPFSRPLLRAQCARTYSTEVGLIEELEEARTLESALSCSTSAAVHASDRRELRHHQHPTKGQVATVGRIELIFGPMFAGKSTELLSRVRSEQGAGRTVALVKSSVDTRYKYDQVTTHNGDKMACTAVDRLMPILEDATLMGKDVIAVDEAQFFHDLVEFVLSASEKHNKTVLVAGLDGDFKRCD
jgi:hypothetical protein